MDVKSCITLGPGANFTNILWAAFTYESLLCIFYAVTICVCNFFFGQRILAQKLLIKFWWNWHLLSTSKLELYGNNIGGFSWNRDLTFFWPLHHVFPLFIFYCQELVQSYKHPDSQVTNRKAFKALLFAIH